jgi:hypothetical protein
MKLFKVKSFRSGCQQVHRRRHRRTGPRSPFHWRSSHAGHPGDLKTCLCWWVRIVQLVLISCFLYWKYIYKTTHLNEEVNYHTEKEFPSPAVAVSWKIVERSIYSVGQLVEHRISASFKNVNSARWYCSNKHCILDIGK